MQPTTTIDTTATLDAENAPENLKDIAKSAIMELSLVERRELLEWMRGVYCGKKDLP